MGTKINNIRNKVLPDGVMLSKWLANEGIGTSEQSAYTKRCTIERLAVGVYKYQGTSPTLYGILSSYDEQGKLDYHIGASSALEIKGISHYVTMGRPRVFIFTPKNHRLPEWIAHLNLDVDVMESSTKVFGDSGLESVEYGDYRLKLSVPERAIMECILLSPKHYNLMDVYYVMEMLTNLRSRLVQQLLENCTSVKVKRMFLYMAQKAKHRWFEKLDLSKIDLGSGPRSFSMNGVTDARFKIVIPKELAEYE